jgi:hypothetical protein
VHKPSLINLLTDHIVAGIELWRRYRKVKSYRQRCRARGWVMSIFSCVRLDLTSKCLAEPHSEVGSLCQRQQECALAAKAGRFEINQRDCRQYLDLSIMAYFNETHHSQRRIGESTSGRNLCLSKLPRQNCFEDVEAGSNLNPAD